MTESFDTVAFVRPPLLPTITSRELADQMGVLHKNLLRIIDKVVIENPSYVDGSRVEPSTYTNKQNKTQPQYHITEVGLLLLAPKLGMHDKVVELFLVRFKKTLHDNFHLIQKQNRLMLEENTKLKAKLKKRETVGSGEEITHYKTDENGRVSKVVSNPSDFTDVELLEAMLSICYVQEKGRARQIANLEQMLRDRGRGIVQPCKYYKTKTVWAKFLD